MGKLAGKMKSIAIIIPIKERLDYLKITLLSLLKSFSYNDVCVIENDTKPNSKEICKRLNINYGFLPISENRFNKCLCFNAGFIFMNSHKKYDYYLFHDADIAVKSSFYSELNQNLSNNPPFIQAYGKKRVLLTNENLGSKILKESINIDLLSEKHEGVSLPPLYSRGHYSVGGSIAVTEEAFLNVGGFDHSLFWGYSPEDCYFWEKLKVHYTPSYADNPPIDMFHIWHKSLSSTNPEKNKLEGFYQNFLSSNFEQKNKILHKAKEDLLLLKNKYLG